MPLAECGALDVAHGDGAAERGREAARRDLADDLAADRDLRALARDRLALGQEADALARRALGDLLLDDRGAGEAALHAALLADAPQQARLDRRGRGVDVVAVEAEAGLEAQRIARAQPDRLDLRLGQQLARDRIGGVGRRRDLVAVAAGIARARDVAARAVDHDEGAGHEFQARRPAAPAAPAPAPPAGPAAPKARARTSARSRRSRRDASADARGRRPCRRH